MDANMVAPVNILAASLWILSLSYSYLIRIVCNFSTQRQHVLEVGV